MQTHSDIKLLFVCSRNQWRSPTAERLFDGVPGYQARSGGTEPSARVRVSEKMIRWADVVLCMERRHAQRLRERFGEALDGRRVVCLDISDDYGFMDAELVDALKGALAEHHIFLPAPPSCSSSTI